MLVMYSSEFRRISIRMKTTHSELNSLPHSLCAPHLQPCCFTHQRAKSQDPSIAPIILIQTISFYNSTVGQNISEQKRSVLEVQNIDWRNLLYSPNGFTKEEQCLLEISKRPEQAEWGPEQKNEIFWIPHWEFSILPFKKSCLDCLLHVLIQEGGLMPKKKLQR